jgi:hypothetical protein
MIVIAVMQRHSGAKALTSCIVGGSCMTAAFFGCVAYGQGAVHRTLTPESNDPQTMQTPLHSEALLAVQEKFVPAMKVGTPFWAVWFASFHVAVAKPEFRSRIVR